MKLRIDRRYRDGQGKIWTVYSLDNGQREDIGPVSAGRWEGEKWETRIFLRDGTYSVDVPEWNLIERV